MSSYVFDSEEILSPPQSRRPRFRAVERAAARALRELCAGSGVLRAAASDVTWRFAWLSRWVSGGGVVLRAHSGTELVVSLTEDEWRERLGDREWWDYDENSRLLAWTLAHPLLLESLSRLLGDSFSADGWDEPNERPAGRVTLGFTAVRADGKLVAGALGLQPVTLVKLVALAGWERAAPDVDWWARRMSAELRIMLPTARIPAAEALATRSGDVLVLGSHAGCWGGLALTHPARVWCARYTQGRIEVTGLAREDSTIRSTSMSEHPSAQSGGPSPGGSLENVPVMLDFDVGSVAVPLAELAAIKPGYVFELLTKLEEARVLIKINGTPVGHGELVTVGDTLGVQLLSIHANGLR